MLCSDVIATIHPGFDQTWTEPQTGLTAQGKQPELGKNNLIFKDGKNVTCCALLKVSYISQSASAA